MEQATLQLRNIVKQFPGVCALDDVTVCASAGQSMGLIGINGAGKSTLMNIIAGVLKQDSGEIILDGKKTEINNPRDAEAAGIAFIHQEPVVFDTMTVTENMFISRLKTKENTPFLDNASMERDAKKYLDILGSTISPKAKLSTIPIGDRQIIEIARALAAGAKYLLFDEPTSSLTFKEKEKLFEVIDSLKQRGDTIVFISHFLDEVAEVCETVTVLRDGRVSGSGNMADFSREDIIKFIIGESKTKEIPARTSEAGAVVVKAEHISGEKLPKDVSFEVRGGEVLGIWGLMGSGRSETVRAMFGLDAGASGTVYLNTGGVLKQVPHTKLLERSGYVTENRHKDGLFLAQPLWKNNSAASLSQFASKIWKVLNPKKEMTAADEMKERLNIKTPDMKMPASQLSGGNQQKVVFSKWLQRRPDFFVLDEPTRGVDVGSKNEIHVKVAELANDGAAVLLISSEIEEILTLSDRVIVMNKGRIVAEVGKDGLERQNLMALCVGEERR